MTLLVVGSDRVGAGKTTFSTGLVARTTAVGFKPRAGNDYWYHHDDYRDAITEGALYGTDARRLAAASPGSLGPSDINPVHRLWRPADGTGLLGQEGREFLLDRAGEQYVLNGRADLPGSARENLPLSEAVVVDSVQTLNQVTEQAHVPALTALGRTIEATDRAVVESYSDVARPIRGIEPDAVAVVDPGHQGLFGRLRQRGLLSRPTRRTRLVGDRPRRSGRDRLAARAHDRPAPRPRDRGDRVRRLLRRVARDGGLVS